MRQLVKYNLVEYMGEMQAWHMPHYVTLLGAQMG